MPKTKVDPTISADLAAALAEYGTWLTYPQAAELTCTSARTLKRETAAGRLPCYQIGRARVLRVKTADVFALIERVR